ncbi:MAG: hypothetical protein LBP96_01435, partial [Bacteroidales bacterium]|nr:hypothetical protein [Bacteroidales bacterium]
IDNGQLKIDNDAAPNDNQKSKHTIQNEVRELKNQKKQLSIINCQLSILLVGGGFGAAPLLYLAKTLNQQHNIRPIILIGGRSKKNILRIEDYVKYGKVLVTTEDGSMGDKGLVTEHPIFHQQKFDQIYCCGPDPMMKAVAKIAIEKNIPCQISLENMMACGIGACLCCVTQTIDGHQCVCTEGPVFDVTKLRIEN